MIPVSFYTPLYHHVMLLVVFGCGLFYWAGQGQAKNFTQFNQVAMIVIGLGLALFIGFRPISGIYFCDMGGYASEYERVRAGYEGRASDVLFNVLMQLCAPFLPAEGFFFVVALIYIAPLAVACWRAHGLWAFPVFLAFLTAFSFWAYGVNGIRNGMALSVLILAFAFHDKPVVMVVLMAVAAGFHGSVLLPAGAFLLVRYIRRTEVWAVFWAACVVITFAVGSAGEMLLSRYNPFAGDTRLDGYISGSQANGFRADFIAYSIIPVAVTLLLAAPTRARRRRLVSRVMSRPVLNRMSNRIAKTAKGMLPGRLTRLRGASPMGSLALAGFGASSYAPRSTPGATPSTLAPGDPHSAVSSQWSVVSSPSPRRSQTKAERPRTGWDRLPWVQFLRSDPFYERLVNTYLLANSVWILVIHATCSNRFAYLSWFMMPWVLLYPFVPGRSNGRPRIEFIAATLCAQYLFTYVMGAIIYPLRGIL